MVASGKRQYRVWGVLTTAVNVNNDSCICNFTVLYTHEAIRGQINSEILLPVIWWTVSPQWLWPILAESIRCSILRDPNSFPIERQIWTWCGCITQFQNIVNILVFFFFCFFFFFFFLWPWPRFFQCPSSKPMRLCGQKHLWRQYLLNGLFFCNLTSRGGA